MIMPLDLANHIVSTTFTSYILRMHVSNRSNTSESVIHTYTHTHTHMHIHTPTLIHTHTFTYTTAHNRLTHIHIHTNTHISIHTTFT